MRHRNEHGNEAGEPRGIETEKYSANPKRALRKHKIRKRRRRLA